MLSNYDQAKIVQQIVEKAIETGKIKIEQPAIPQPVVKEETPSYEGGRLTFFDLLTCILFTLKLLGLIDINWLLVFLPFAFPYIVFYGMLWSMMLWAKFKNRKNKDNGITERAESKGKTN